MSTPSRRAGFTLIEILCTLGLTVLLFAGVYAVFPNAIRTVNTNAAQTKAALLDSAKTAYLSDAGPAAYSTWNAFTTNDQRFNQIRGYIGLSNQSWTQYSTSNPSFFTYTMGALSGQTTYVYVGH